MIEQTMAQQNLIYKCIVGSKLYGTFTEDSDTDYLGVFVPGKGYTLGFKVCEQVELKTNPSNSRKANTKSDVDYTCYAVPKIVQMLIKNNPTALEILYVPKNCIVADSVYGKLLRDNMHLFVSKKAKHTFVGYAISQKSKVLNKKDRYSQFIKALDIAESWLKDGHTELPQTLELNTDLIEKGHWMSFQSGMPTDAVLEAINKELLAYGRRLDQVKRLGYDPKFISHVVRLLDEGIELMVEGKLTFPLNNNRLVRDIKQGKYALSDILKWIDDRERGIEEAYIRSSLPNTPDLEAVNKLQVRILEEYYEQSDRADGPP